MPLRSREDWFWQRFDPKDKRASGALPNLRKAINREAGTVPELWPYYRVILSDREASSAFPSPKLVAEHSALGLFGVHQQSQGDRRMHVADMSMSVALRTLRASGRYSADALDRRVNAAATATSTGELVQHLRGLITQLRTEHLAFDYTQLVNDIYDWDSSERRKRVRRRWGADYFGWADPASSDSPTTDNSTTDAAAKPDTEQ
ncbi:type I-E CRISPR-associated protein Cse2/CasB [Actinosynnema sp. ALI-1.44]|uniref:type I-E CRISPR-associated protein Cse2/CasB n=1 Tax=Actinosynnema sp. ALI-1.44 TaxID=1933779 RepID=UPI00097C00CB|nr:type I-E CRISPR-associated protein Cse2/CasB [Actinosynnema sp. ALI-1.44]ONI91969.1 type I-E CRISPR-associated protein Cse2/CasB [Actinosynnema sp. ALI-1.44]